MTETKRNPNPFIRMTQAANEAKEQQAKQWSELGGKSEVKKSRTAGAPSVIQPKIMKKVGRGG
jgi:hypothetical protein